MGANTSGSLTPEGIGERSSNAECLQVRGEESHLFGELDRVREVNPLPGDPATAKLNDVNEVEADGRS